MPGSVGLKSYLGKDDYPVAGRIALLHDGCAMDKRDPFIEGLRVLIEMRPDLNPTNISLAAGKDKTTVRKLLTGANASPRIDTAEAIAKATGYSLSTIIALGSHPGARDALSILKTYDSLDEGGRRALTDYLEFLAERKGKNEAPT